MKSFTMNEMETIFEIGRQVQMMCDEGEIEIFDSKTAFISALELAIEFEKTYPDSEDYYGDMDMFVADRVVKEFKNE